MHTNEYTPKFILFSYFFLYSTFPKSNKTFPKSTKRQLSNTCLQKANRWLIRNCSACVYGINIVWNISESNKVKCSRHMWKSIINPDVLWDILNWPKYMNIYSHNFDKNDLIGRSLYVLITLPSTRPLTSIDVWCRDMPGWKRCFNANKTFPQATKMQLSNTCRQKAKRCLIRNRSACVYDINVVWNVSKSNKVKCSRYKSKPIIEPDVRWEIKNYRQ